ncbi:MAG: hypothetical protein V3U16_02055 [Candidatus Neomarinimicrobiota bacterium]
MYQRLRDFDVPAPILDEIFGRPDDLKILEDTWTSLKETRRSDDECARLIADQIYTDLDLKINQE